MAPERRKVKGVWYIKETWHTYHMKAKETKLEEYKRQLQDVYSAIRFLFGHAEQAKWGL